MSEKGGALSAAVTFESQFYAECEMQIGGFSWFAVQTKPRHEKKVESELSEKGLKSFLPLHRERRRWSDRQKWVEVPLFSNYLFVRMPEESESRTRVLRTAGVVRFVGAPGRGTPLPDEQIESLRTIVSEGVPIAAHSYLNVGERIRICGGTLHGIEGVLVAIKGDRKLVVSVDLIQKSVAIQLEGFHVERI